MAAGVFAVKNTWSTLIPNMKGNSAQCDGVYLPLCRCTRAAFAENQMNQNIFLLTRKRQWRRRFNCNKQKSQREIWHDHTMARQPCHDSTNSTILSTVQYTCSTMGTQRIHVNTLNARALTGQTRTKDGRQSILYYVIRVQVLLMVRCAFTNRGSQSRVLRDRQAWSEKREAAQLAGWVSFQVCRTSRCEISRMNHSSSPWLETWERTLCSGIINPNHCLADWVQESGSSFSSAFLNWNQNPVLRRNRPRRLVILEAVEAVFKAVQAMNKQRFVVDNMPRKQRKSGHCNRQRAWWMWLERKWNDSCQGCFGNTHTSQLMPTTSGKKMKHSRPRYSASRARKKV